MVAWIFLLAIATATASNVLDELCSSSEDRASSVIAFLSSRGDYAAAEECAANSLSIWSHSEKIWTSIYANMKAHSKVNRAAKRLAAPAPTPTGAWKPADESGKLNPSLCADDDTEIHISNTWLNVTGYQNYNYHSPTREFFSSNRDIRLQVKEQIMVNFAFWAISNPEYVFLDIGANSGFFSILAAISGAKLVKSIDTSKRSIELIKQVSALIGISNIDAVERERGIEADLNNSSDVTLAFALIHWMYASSAKYTSLENVVAALSNLCRKALIIEWVDASAIQLPQWRKEFQIQPYTHENFLLSLCSRFAQVEVIGFSMAVRKVYVASHRKKRSKEQVQKDVARLLNKEAPLIVVQMTILTENARNISSVISISRNENVREVSAHFFESNEISASGSAEFDKRLASIAIMNDRISEQSKEVISSIVDIHKNPCLRFGNSLQVCFGAMMRFEITNKQSLSWQNLRVDL